jgi:hypothetical protein
LFFPYDRVAVVTFDRHVHCSTCDNAGDRLSLALTSDENQIHTRIRNLWVYQAGTDSTPDADVGKDGATSDTCNGWPFYNDLNDGTSYKPGPQNAGPCRWYNPGPGGSFIGLDCPSAYLTGGDFSSCTTTNIGGGLMAAGDEFAASMRQEALWVVILLTDGAANSSTDASGNLPFGFCPNGTNRKGEQPYCRDAEPEIKDVNGNVIGWTQTRHCYDVPGVTMDNRAMCLGVTNPTWDFAGTLDDGSHYDADDFARDMADWLSQNNVLTFSIGLGRLVNTSSKGDPLDGEELLKYTAGVAGGQYFFAPDSTELRQIFAKIADNIATRLTR